MVTIVDSARPRISADVDIGRCLNWWDSRNGIDRVGRVADFQANNQSCRVLYFRLRKKHTNNGVLFDIEHWVIL